MLFLSFLQLIVYQARDVIAKLRILNDSEDMK